MTILAATAGGVDPLPLDEGPGPCAKPGRRQRPLWFYLPETFDPLAILPASLHRRADYARYIVHLVTVYEALGRTDKRGYVRLMVELLRQIIPTRDERPLRLALVEGGVLDHDRHYTIGEHSMGYRLTPAFSGRATTITQCQDPEVTRRVRRAKDSEYQAVPRLNVHKYLFDWLKLLEIDGERAHQIVWDTPRLLERASRYHAVIDLIESGDPCWSVCRMGRVHHVGTRLPKELKPTLSIDGQRLVGVDATNAQPLLLALLLRHYVENDHRLPFTPNFDQHRGKRTYSDLPNTQRPITTTRPPNPESSFPSSLSITLCAEAQDHSEVSVNSLLTDDRFPLPDDAQKYLRLCEDGTFYEHMQDRLRSEGYDLPRKEVKPLSYTLFYGSDAPAHVHENPHVRAFVSLFRAEFSTVARFARKVKREFGHHSYLAKLMQHYEASIIINQCCRRLMKEHPDVPVVTIHDNILTVPAHVGLVSRIMAEEFLRAGVRAQFQVDAPMDVPMAKAA